MGYPLLLHSNILTIGGRAIGFEYLLQTADQTLQNQINNSINKTRNKLLREWLKIDVFRLGHSVENDLRLRKGNRPYLKIDRCSKGVIRCDNDILDCDKDGDFKIDDGHVKCDRATLKIDDETINYIHELWTDKTPSHAQENALSLFIKVEAIGGLRDVRRFIKDN